MRCVIWYNKSMVIGRPILKVYNRDLWNPPLAKEYEPIDCEVIEVE